MTWLKEKYFELVRWFTGTKDANIIQLKGNKNDADRPTSLSKYAAEYDDRIRRREQIRRRKLTMDPRSRTHIRCL